MNTRRAHVRLTQRRYWCLTAGAVALVGAAGRTFAHQGHAEAQRKQTAAPAASGFSERLSLPDTKLIDHDGRERRLTSDVLRDRLAIVGFFYTTCGTVCPILSQLMLQVERKLGPRAGRDVTLLSLSLDPLRDTPPRLSEYRRSLGAGDDWVWLTGARPQVEEALRAFGAYTADPARHPSQLMVGDARSGRWLRLNGFPSVQQVLDAVARVGTERSRGGPS
jgi:protein SCO1